MIRCPKCNKELPEDSKFCKACGAKILTAEEKQKSTKKKIIAIIAVLLAIIIGLSGFIIFDKINNKPDVTKATTESQVLNNNPAKPNGNNTSNNPSGEDIYKAPDGKYYVLSKAKYTNVTTDPKDDVLTSNYIWNENSVEYFIRGKFILEFDNDGKILKQTDGFWNFDLNDWDTTPFQTEYLYSNGYLEKIIEKSENETLKEKTYKYDSNGNTIESIMYIPADDNLNVYKFEYDSQNRLAKAFIDNSNLFSNAQLTYTYKDNYTVSIQVKSYEDTSSQSIDVATMKFNNFGKIEKFEYSVSVDDVKFEMICLYSYDENQNLIKLDYTESHYYDGKQYDTNIIYEFEWKEGPKTQAVVSDALIEDYVGEYCYGLSSYRYPITAPDLSHISK